MNTYAKYCPNVFVAKCTETHTNGETIELTTKYGKTHECIVFNFLFEREGFYYYSIVRADGFNVQEFAKKKAEKLAGYAEKAEQKSTAYYNASNKDSSFLSLGEPIKIGHHSEKRHRKAIENVHNNMRKCIEMDKKAEEYTNRVDYWAKKANSINLSMPESLEYYEFLLETAKQKHEGIKSGAIPKEHSFSLTYAKKEVNEIEKKLIIAQKLWA